ncbi:MAG: 2-oxo acid dehydrogenase subunit E2 [Acidobacteria bacterium]|nr:2-oxo acid dehydrogenase subunit E2 [Acidobacteriota bacterium]
MAVSVVMPALEMAQETGKLIAWLKKEGEPVRKGEMLLEVETDKAVVEVEALGDGILAGITAREGDVIPVGQTIAWLVQAGEAPPDAASAPAQTGRRVDTTPTVAAVVAPAPPSAGRGARISPKARRLAQERGVDLEKVVGTGPGGEILAEDVLNAAEAAVAPDAAAGRRIEATSIGRLMAERTTQSWTTVPHFFVTRDVDAGALNAARERLIAEVERSHGVKVTHTDLLVAAIGRTLRQHPLMNASWNGTGITVNPHVNIALAMAVDGQVDAAVVTAAVVTAVVRDADALSIGEIASRRHELAERARAGRLQPADLAGGTFTISNLGMFGVDAFTAVIVPPQAGILAVGAIREVPAAFEGRIEIRPSVSLTLSCDHRVIDGARAALFLNDVVDAVHRGSAPDIRAEPLD